jgi:hypothetical protein
MNRLVENYLEIFEDIEPNKSIQDNAAFEKHNIEKKYRLGYSQFLAELTALEILPPECLRKIFGTLFELINKHSKVPEKRMLVDEYVDCLLRMSRVLKTPSEFFGKIRMIIHNENTTNNSFNQAAAVFRSFPSSITNCFQKPNLRLQANWLPS